MRYECNFCNNEPCVFVSSTPDSVKPEWCPMPLEPGDTDDDAEWVAAPLDEESTEKSDNKQSTPCTCGRGVVFMVGYDYCPYCGGSFK